MDQNGSWRDEIKALRGKIDAIASGTSEQVNQLRAELVALERRLVEQELPSTPPPLPPAVEISPARLESVKTPEPIKVVPVEPQPVTLEIPAKVAQVIEKAKKPKDDTPFELRFGRVWLVRIGIAILITGLVLLANYAYRNWIRDLPAGVRLSALYGCAVALGWGGIWLAAKETFKRYGEVVLAGGLAFFYYCTYAAHHVARLRVIESPVLAGVLLLGAAGLIAGVSWIRKARVTAVMGILLASYATMLQPLGWLSAFSNLLLAVVGIALMLRPGWKTPGVVSMIGAYGSFLGWQLLGMGASRLADPAVLWFLPSTWAVFAAPGLLNRFRDSMSDYGKAWFTGCNNAAFFLFFSGVWHQVHGNHSYWAVPAVFGAVLVVLGVIGRRLGSKVGAVHMAQGILALSFALILKLDGYQLTLGFAMEAVLLSLAFLRYHKRTELIFALLCAFTALAGSLLGYQGIALQVPLWTAGVQTLLLAVAGLIVRIGCDRDAPERRESSRVMAGAMLVVATLMGIAWVVNLHWVVPVASAIGALLAFVSWRCDQKRWLPELLGFSGAFALVSLCCVIFKNAAPAELLLTVVFAGAAVLLWERLRDGLEEQKEAASWSTACIWLWGALVPLSYAIMVERLHVGDQTDATLLAVGVVGLTLAALWLRSHRMALCVTSLHWLVMGVCFWGIAHRDPSVWVLLPVLSSSISLAWACRWPSVAVPRDQPSSPGLIRVLRVTLFVAWVGAWAKLLQGGFTDAMALSALAVGFACLRFKKTIFVEAWLLLVISLFSFLAGINPFAWGERIHPHWHGWALVLTTMIMAWYGTSEKTKEKPSFLLQIMPWLANAVLLLWTTQILVDRFDWKPVAILWSLLGFALVSTGLIYRRWAFRVAGFVVLGMALLKLFLVDVWDFTAFMRVASFIILGLAMMLLGLFYHRFAPTLKRWMEADSEQKGKGDAIS